MLGYFTLIPSIENLINNIDPDMIRCTTCGKWNHRKYITTIHGPAFYGGKKKYVCKHGCRKAAICDNSS